MNIKVFRQPEDTCKLEAIAKRAFGATPDSKIEDWFSFTEMNIAIESRRGICLSAVSAEGDLVGFIYAQQENPINGKEGLEKWVIVMAAVDPNVADQGVGTALLDEIEKQALVSGAVKMFVYTNKGDNRVESFYRKNEYKDAGWVKDYQHGQDNSAVFLIKHLR